MAHNLIIKPEAFDDIDDAISWYEEQKEGLGLELRKEIFDVIRYIEKYPKHSQERYRAFRVRYTSRFQYGIHYTIEEQTIFVHAVMHTARQPKSTDKNH
jgi:plasmid stabilization system protein ParE